MNAIDRGIPKDIADAIRGQIGDPVADLSRGCRLTEDLGFDSLDMVELVIAMEELRDIEISDDDLGGVTTLGGLVDAIEAATVRSGSAS